MLTLESAFKLAQKALFVDSKKKKKKKKKKIKII